MKKYRKRPIIVEAEQYLGFYNDPWPEGVDVDRSIEGGTQVCVITAHGHKTPVEKGDWIIKEPDGRGYYPCKPDIFDKTYELVE